MRKTITAAILAAAMLSLAACGGSGIPGVNTGDLQQSSQDLQAAAQECSTASGTLSDSIQEMLAGIKAEDQAQIDAAKAKLEDAAAQMKDAAAKIQTASEGMGDIPFAGQQAQAGTEMIAKTCQANSELAQDIASKVSAAKGQAAYDELNKALESFDNKLQKSADEMNASMPSP